MKSLVILLVFFLFFNKTWAQEVINFDSLKVYTHEFYCEPIIGLSKEYLMSNGDSVKITDITKVNNFYKELNGMKKNISIHHLKKIRRDSPPDNLDLRAIFAFYKGLKQTIIGLSYANLMFIDNSTFERNSNKLEDIVKSCSQLYINLFPTGEQFINKYTEKAKKD